MDREILFRGKRLENGEWIEGDLLHSYFKKGDVCICCPDWTNIRRVYPSTVGQYTGLTDKNGKKIFEGDIVSAHFKTNRSKQIFRVIFRGGAFQLDNGHIVVGFADVYSLNVIGNIHNNDNPELIGGEGDG